MTEEGGTDRDQGRSAYDEFGEPIPESVWAPVTGRIELGQTAEIPTASEAPWWLSGGDGGDSQPPPSGLGWREPPEGPTRPRSSRRFVAALMLAALAAGGLGAGLGVGLSGSSPAPSASKVASPVAPLPQPTTAAVPSSVSAVEEAVQPAVVEVNTEVAVGTGSPTPAAGTGMIVTPNGEILTNNHVVEGAISIMVAISGRPGNHPAKVIGVDPTDDVALIQVSGLSGLPYVSLGNSSSVKVGEPVIAIGNALGLGSLSTTTGGVAALDRSITAQDEVNSSEQLKNMIEIDAQIYPGDSGGPLLNSSGQVIGMDTAASSSDSSFGGLSSGPTLGFAIPINRAVSIANQIRRGAASTSILYGESAFMGVATEASGSQLPGGAGNSFGFYFGNSGTGTTTPTVAGAAIGGVVTDGPASAAGIAGGDVITSVGGQKVTAFQGSGSSTLQTLIAKYRPGSSVSVSYVDPSGAAHTTTVQLTGIAR